MILRKPYAFFIKYFKILHAIIALLIAFLLYRSFTIYNFFRAYIDDYNGALNEFLPSSLINMYSFILALGIIILIIVLLSVMIYKKKPKALYIYSLIVYVAVITLYFVSYPTLRNISAELVDIRFSSALRDFFMIVSILQLVSLVWFVVRATGFDIKQFDFGSDLQKLDIDEKDSEEIEVSLEFDKNRVNRQVRGKLREFKYLYGEHKFIFNTAGVIVLIIIIFNVYLNLTVYSATYNQGTSFTASGVVMNIRDSYLTQTNPTGKKLTDDMVVVVKMDIKKQGSINKVLNTGLATLRIGNESYSQNNDYAKELYDLGTPYVNQTLNNEFQTYILAYVIPKNDANNKMTLKFNDDVSYVKGEIGAKNIFVNLKPTDLRKKAETIENKIGETQNYEDSVLGNTFLEIDKYEISDKFRVDYKYCYATNKCIDSYEYLTPTPTGNYYKVLMKVSGKFSIDSNINSNKITNLNTFLNTFCTLNYKIGNSWKSQKLYTQDIKPKVAKDSGIYIEVPYEIKDAKEMYFTFNVRNYVYKYVLK